MKRINRKDVDLRRFDKHREFVCSIMDAAASWFQLLCFLYVAAHAILMAHDGDTEKSINWALVALIIKPFGSPIKAA